MNMHTGKNNTHIYCCIRENKLEEPKGCVASNPDFPFSVNIPPLQLNGEKHLVFKYFNKLKHFFESSSLFLI